MKATKLLIPDVFLIESEVFTDDRGYFFESFNQKKINETIGYSPNFVQDNHSKSKKGVLRGLHYQLAPKGQCKLVRAVQGKVFDAVVDIRKKSPTFGQWIGEVLSGENNRQLWIPEGVAHGFVVLSETADFLYKTTNYYAPEYERCILWNDQDIKIDCPFIDTPLLSEKDQHGELFQNAEHFT